MKAPAFQFYARDFLVSTMGWPAEEVGIYIRLLALQWDREGLPVAEDELRDLSGARRLVPERVLNKFPIVDGVRLNRRLETVRAEQRDYSRGQSENGRKGGKAKAAKKMALLQQNAGGASDSHVAERQPNLALQSASATAIHPLNPPQAGEGIDGEGEVKTRKDGAGRAVERVTAGGSIDAF